MRYRSLCILLSLAALLGGSVAWAGTRGKTQLPIEVVVGPTQAGVTAETIKPGSTVEIAVSGTAYTAISDMRIEAALEDGAELVSGELAWSGPASKGDTKQLVFTVRTPTQGNGKIVAAVTLFKDGKPVGERKGQYILGVDNGQKTLKPAYKLKKDSAGRNIIEY
jgi:hypothetical protein